jgi:glucan biosynthesis protein C
MPERYHSLDALRGMAMLLGIVLHAAMSFIPMPAPALIWPAADQSTSVWFAALMVGAHAFRLQTFFLLAGFFGALIFERRGLGGFLLHRGQRIALPLLLSCLVLIPICQAVFVIGFNLFPGEPYLKIGREVFDMRAYKTNLVEFFAGGTFLRKFLWFHTWFLCYLALAYVAAVVVSPLSRRVTSTAWFVRLFRRLVASPVKPLLLAVPTVLVMLPMKTWQADTPMHVMPEWRILLYYGLFFSFGWLLYHQRDLLAECARLWRTQLLLGVLVAFPLFLGLFVRFGPVPPGVNNPVYRVPAIACYSLFTWLMVFGGMGLFIRCFSRPSGTMRYLSDASYWMYLAHLPLVIVLQIVVADWPGGALAKFLLVNVLTVLVLLVTYHYGVRYTWVGAMLNGRKVRAERPAPTESLSQTTTESHVTI